METNDQIQEHWYPKSIKQRALVDEYLEWQHNNTRMACAMYFQSKWLQPLMSGKPPNESKIQLFKNHMETTLDILENTWLENAEKTFLTTDSEISFADILCACEIEQPRIAGYNPFEGRPKLTSWYKKVKELTDPYYTEAHAILNKLANKSQSKL